MSDELRAELGIRRLHARYADAVFRQDYAAFEDCFTRDAEWHVGTRMFSGREACGAFLKSCMKRLDWVLMTFQTPILEIDGATATGRTFVTEQSGKKDGSNITSVATYYERFAEEDGVWRRSWAFFQLHFTETGATTKTFFPQPDYGPPPAMPPATGAAAAPATPSD